MQDEWYKTTTKTESNKVQNGHGIWSSCKVDYKYVYIHVRGLIDSIWVDYLVANSVCITASHCTELKYIGASNYAEVLYVMHSWPATGIQRITEMDGVEYGESPSPRATVHNFKRQVSLASWI